MNKGEYEILLREIAMLKEKIEVLRYFNTERVSINRYFEDIESKYERPRRT